MAEFTIGAAGPEDMTAVRSLIEAYIEEPGVDNSYQGTEEELADLPGPYAAPGGLILLAGRESAPDPVGVIAYKPLDEETCVMKRLYVAPEARRFGIGEKLCLELMERARAQGYTVMKLDTLDHLKVAIKLYQRLGFRPCEPFTDSPIEHTHHFSIRL